MFWLLGGVFIFLIAIFINDLFWAMLLSGFSSIILVWIGARYYMEFAKKELTPAIEAIPVSLDFENGGLPSHVLRADNQFYVETSNIKLISLFAGIVLVFIVLFGVVMYEELEGNRKAQYIFFLILAGLMTLGPLFFTSTNLVFDRMNGTVTFPYLRFTRPITILFTELTICPDFRDNYRLSIQHPQFMLNYGLFLHFPLGDTEKREGQSSDSLRRELRERQWSFYCAYMDRNRLLPPGEMFDPYRHDDLIRLLKEGLPRPLYWCAPDVQLPHEENSWLRGSELFETCIRRFPVQMLDARKEGMNYCMLHGIRMGAFSFIGICGDYFVFDPNKDMPEVFDVIAESECYGILVNGYHSKVRYITGSNV